MLILITLYFMNACLNFFSMESHFNSSHISFIPPESLYIGSPWYRYKILITAKNRNCQIFCCFLVKIDETKNFNQWPKSISDRKMLQNWA